MLVENLVKNGVLKTKEYIEAFLKIDRAQFVPEDLKEDAYADMPLPIGEGQTISQPWTVAFMIELLRPEAGNTVLDIGAGSGWQTALLAYIVSKQGNNAEKTQKNAESGRIIAIERIPNLCEFGKDNISKFNFIKKGVVEFLCQDGSKGYEKEAPYDRIVLAASAGKIPNILIEQLKPKGILVGVEGSNVVRVIKDEEEKIKKEEFHGFSFVPLVEE